MSKEALVLVAVLALHTVTRPDDLGGSEDHPRGTVFEVDESELERLERVGAARKATKEEIKDAKNGSVNVVDPIAHRSYAEVAREAQVAAHSGEVADYEGQTTTGTSSKKSDK